MCQTLVETQKYFWIKTQKLLELEWSKWNTWLKTGCNKNLDITQCSMFFIVNNSMVLQFLLQYSKRKYIYLGISVFFEATGCWTKEKIPNR